MVLSDDLVQDRRHLQVIVRFNIFHAPEGTHFWGKQVVHSSA